MARGTAEDVFSSISQETLQDWERFGIRKAVQLGQRRPPRLSLLFFCATVLDYR